MTGVRTEGLIKNIVADRDRMSEDDIARLVVDREPCARCAVRKDRHDGAGHRFVGGLAA